MAALHKYPAIFSAFRQANRWCFALLSAFVLLGATVTLAAQVPEPRIDSGAFLYKACQIRLKVIDNPNFSLAPREASSALMCDSYIQGFTDGMVSASHDFCPLPVTREQAIRKYVLFVAENSFLKVDKLIAVALVLQDLYRCPQSKNH
jgi:hypothetical protein